MANQVKAALAAATEDLDRKGDPYDVRLFLKGGRKLRGAPYEFAPEDNGLTLGMADGTKTWIRFDAILAFNVIPS